MECHRKFIIKFFDSSIYFNVRLKIVLTAIAFNQNEKHTNEICLRNSNLFWSCILKKIIFLKNRFKQATVINKFAALYKL